MIITLKNTFHNTQVNVRVKTLPMLLSEYTSNRVIKELCPFSDCQCGGVYGPQHDPEGSKLHVEWDVTSAGKGKWRLLISSA